MARGNSSDNKKKAARIADGPRALAFARSFGEKIAMLLRPLVPLTILFVVYVGISYLLWVPLTTESGTVTSAQAHLSQSEIVNAVKGKQHPLWISKNDYELIANAALPVVSKESISVFEPNLSRRIAEAYQRNPWVERVREVRLRYPARMEVDLEFRKPFVRIDNGEVLDRQGYALNISADNLLLRKLPLVTGVAQKTVAVGKHSVEKPVLDALDLIAVVRDAMNNSNLRVASVDQKEGMWRIQTLRGPVVLWGAFSDDPPVDEPKTAEKVALLRRRLSECKNPEELEYIKVYIAQAPVKPRIAAVSSEALRP